MCITFECCAGVFWPQQLQLVSPWVTCERITSYVHHHYGVLPWHTRCPRHLRAHAPPSFLFPKILPNRCGFLNQSYKRLVTSFPLGSPSENLENRLKSLTLTAWRVEIPFSMDWRKNLMCITVWVLPWHTYCPRPWLLIICITTGASEICITTESFVLT